MGSFINALPGALAQGMIWGIMAIGLYITYKILELSDLSVDGTFPMGCCVTAVLIASGVNPVAALFVAFAAGCAAGCAAGSAV